MKIIFLGAPGAGKGTQASKISERLGIPTISTGNLLRAEIAEGSEYGKQLEAMMSAGNLVPDEIVERIVAKNLAAQRCKNGYILDGFPRTVTQAEALSNMGIEADIVISIEVPDEEIVARLSGRRTCINCGETYHVFNAPSKDGDNCEKCGTLLVRRTDDEPEAIKTRLKNFHNNTEPLKDYYSNKSNLVLVDSSSIEMTFERIIAAIGE